MEIFRQKNVATTVAFPLVSAGGTNFRASLTFQSADSLLSLDNAALVTASAQPSGLAGGMYVLGITQNQMNNDTIDIKIVDAAGGPAWEDQFLKIKTEADVSAVTDNVLQNYAAASAGDPALRTDAELDAVVSAAVNDALNDYSVVSAADPQLRTNAEASALMDDVLVNLSLAKANAVTTAAMSATIMTVLQAYKGVTAADPQIRTDAETSALMDNVLVNLSLAKANAVTTAAMSATFMNVLQAHGAVSATDPQLRTDVETSALYNKVLQENAVATAADPALRTDAELDAVVSAAVNDALNEYGVVSAGAVTTAALSATMMNVVQAYGPVTAGGTIDTVTNITDAAVGINTITTAAYRQIAGTVYRISYASARNQAEQQEAVTSRSLLGAVGKLVNRVEVSGTDLEIYHEDDTTNFFDQSITQTSASAAIVGLNTEP